MADFFQFLQGKKTYIVATLTFIAGGVESLHQAGVISWDTPVWVWPLLGALGLGAIRSGINTAANQAALNTPVPPPPGSKP